MLDLLKKLISIHAFSGREDELAAFIKDYMTPLSDEVRIDRLGSVICVIRGDGEDKKKLMYAAHMDEVGMIVTYIESSGYIRFTNNGFPNWTSLAYREVVFESGAHGMVVPQVGCDGSPSPEKMYVDIGTSSREETEKYVNIGDCFAAVNYLTEMSGSVVAGRPIDNRIGCAVLMKLAERLHNRPDRPYHDVYLVFTVQEETALPAVGGSAAAFGVMPDIGIAVDVCATGDAIGALPMDSRVGGGAVVQIRDNTAVFDRELVKQIISACDEKAIPYQRLVAYNGGTDAVPMQKVGLGCRAGAIGIPMRYLHTSAEIADISDAEACVDLCAALCDRPIATN